MSVPAAQGLVPASYHGVLEPRTVLVAETLRRNDGSAVACPAAWQIVHNAHVVADLEARGAVFVHQLDAVPDGSTVVFSAHGVSPAVHAEAERRGSSSPFPAF